MAKLRISYTKSAIGYSQRQKDTIRSLGLRKLNSVVVHDDTPVIRGMIFKVQHLVQVEEVSEGEAVQQPAPATGATRVLAETPTAPAARPAPARSRSAAKAAPAADDLTVVEGIGPKVNEVLGAAGITTYAELAAADLERLNSILADANLQMLKPDTWSEQAALAADGKWDDLKALQERLTAGRRAE
jgi:ribosomal protein L30